MLLTNSPSVQRVPIDTLRLSATPVRRHPKKEIEKTRKLVAKHGQVPPVLAAPNGEIIFWEVIWLALKADGATEVDVVIVTGKSPTELRALQLALNRIPLDASWDDQNVRIILEDLVRVDFDLDLTGFETPEIDHHLNLDAPQANVEENASDIPPLETKAVTSRGVIWAAGENRIGCGDATDLDFVSHVLDGRRAHVCFVDPPYNIPVHGFFGKGRNKRREFVSGAGELTSEQFYVSLLDTLKVLKACSAPTALIFACIDWRHLLEMTVAGRACEMPLYQIITWVKSNAGMGGIYRNASEFITVFRAGDEAPLDNVELGRHGRNRTNVWNYPSMSAFGKQRDLLALHPTIKPVAMVADALRDVTRRGEVVLDTYLGSGTSLIAAQETGRVCCGVELDPLYVDVAIRRWQNLTGREATALKTGDTFNRVAQRLLDPPAGLK